MKFTRKELIIIKNWGRNELELCCVPEVMDTGAKDLAYLQTNKFENIENGILAGSQSVLKKVIKELVDLNDNSS